MDITTLKAGEVALDMAGEVEVDVAREILGLLQCILQGGDFLFLNVFMFICIYGFKLTVTKRDEVNPRKSQGKETVDNPVELKL